MRGEWLHFTISKSLGFPSCILIMFTFEFQGLTSGSENDRNDSASQSGNQSDTGKQGLGPLSSPNPVHAAVKVRMGPPPSTCLSTGPQT